MTSGKSNEQPKTLPSENFDRDIKLFVKSALFNSLVKSCVEKAAVARFDMVNFQSLQD